MTVIVFIKDSKRNHSSYDRDAAQLERHANAFVLWQWRCLRQHIGQGESLHHVIKTLSNLFEFTFCFIFFDSDAQERGAAMGW